MLRKLRYIRHRPSEYRSNDRALRRKDDAKSDAGAQKAAPATIVGAIIARQEPMSTCWKSAVSVCKCTGQHCFENCIGTQLDKRAREAAAVRSGEQWQMCTLTHARGLPQEYVRNGDRSTYVVSGGNEANKWENGGRKGRAGATRTLRLSKKGSVLLDA